ncbi:zinc transporter ZntB [Nitrogeniibacter mangrovi]|uniref:Zinc transporter ZntB n=1 Tax=Nitrogeniibacter mangrovi TaxID=2016596 RepID=A0A6C1B0Q4_9RHOO|nr:zinc transporter ZntB [Nitrogeniibacter mangrovi]QID16408.1 zinc transporter ZntB [Nitrogeniibacter mangrovi]
MAQTDTPPNRDISLDQPVIHLCFDAQGQQVTADAPAQVFEWIHLKRGSPEADAWLADSGLSPLVINALTQEETRPRCTVDDEGALLILRGVNLMAGADPEDMVSVRFFIDEHRVVSVWRRALLSVGDLLAAVARGHGPTGPGDLIARIALRLTDRAEPIVATLNERVDDLEEQVLDGNADVLRRELADVRRMSIMIRRFMFPQRDALTTLEIEDLPWLGRHDRARVREANEHTARLAEELEAIRDRATVVHEQIMDMRAEAMNRSMFMLAIVTTVFLPLGLVTGLLGINVGGIPGAQNADAFWVVCAVLGALVVGQLALFRWLKIY